MNFSSGPQGKSLSRAAIVVVCLAFKFGSVASLAADTPVATDQALNGKALFDIACSGCHRIDPNGRHDVGSNLYGIVGEPAGTRPGYAFSDALVSKDLRWDRETLAAWIVATEMLVPGTKMAYSNILSGEEVSRVITYLLEAAEDKD